MKPLRINPFNFALTPAAVVLYGLGLLAAPGAQPALTPIAQRFQQEVAEAHGAAVGLPEGPISLLDINEHGDIRIFVSGQWWSFNGSSWTEDARLRGGVRGEWVFPGAGHEVCRVSLDGGTVKQLVRHEGKVWIVTTNTVHLWNAGTLGGMEGWSGRQIHQAAVSPEGVLYVASETGLFRQSGRTWERIPVIDPRDRDWAAGRLLALAVDPSGTFWIGTRAGVASGSPGKGWKFFEPRDGVPVTRFTGASVGTGGDPWFGTETGAVFWREGEWHYRQGLRWMPHDQVKQVGVDASGSAWFITAGGLGRILRKPMSLHEKAAHYEQEIEQYVKRTPFGYVAEAALRRPGDRTSADPHDSDNDGLWTAMYGAGECFGYGATREPALKERARKAFEALRFLQKVTQGGPHAPPKGYVARTVRSVKLPDPNLGRIESDRRTLLEDRLWKVYEPRWPKSADGQWYWKSDTSSDELDGHYFFYPLYFDLCAEDEAEKNRVREVVRDLTDHLVDHGFLMIDHDGKPTRWGIFSPEYLNSSTNWWPERGLNSLSMLSYLSVAHHITGDSKYLQAQDRLIRDHHYMHNAMYPKVQHGAGTGNQSDDEMAFMSYYCLLRYSKNETLTTMIRLSFFRYWSLEAAEMNPFFNFSYAPHGLGRQGSNPWGDFSLAPRGSWLEDSRATLYGFPIDRLDWAHRNSHREDLIVFGTQRPRELESDDSARRGHRTNGKVLPVENRHFGHWNTDPWRLDYGGRGGELGAGTVFLLPYYMGLYHGFVQKP